MKDLGNHLDVFQASAGSGKTYTLVKQFLAIAFQKPGYQFKQILALTFTNAAAHEMKERVVDALKDICEQNDTGLISDYAAEFEISTTEVVQRAKEVLEAILMNYDGLSIMTIDAFQQRVVKGFTTELGLPNDFNTLIENLTLKEELLATLVNQIGLAPDFTKTALLHQKELLKDQKSWDLTDIIESTLKKVWHQKGKQTGTSAEALIHIYNHVSKEIKDLIQLAKEVKKEVNAIYAPYGWSIESLNRNCLYKQFINHLSKPNLDFIMNDKKGQSSWDFMEGYRAQFREKGKGYGAGKVDDKKTFDEITISQLTPLFEKVLDAFLAIPPVHFLYYKYKSQFIELAFVDFIQDFFYKVKEQRSMVSIGDSELIINRLIAADELPFIYEKLGLRYKYILIDEFQDTSTKQWENLKPLVSESLANGAYSMIVGDVKQSIYGFRGGEAQQFVDLYHQKDPELRVNPNALETNYRSYPQIIQFNNTFFEKLYKYQELGKFNIFEKGAQKVFEGKYKDKMELGYIHADITLEENKDTKEEQRELFQKKIIQRIQFYVAKGYLYSDICILDRGNNHLAEIALLLQEHGIPSLVEGKLFLVDNPLIKGFESLLLNYLGINKELNQRIVFETFAQYGDFDLDAFEKQYYKGNQLDWECFAKEFNLPEFKPRDLLLNLWQNFKSNDKISIPNTQYLRIFEELIYDLEKKNAAINLSDFWLFWEVERVKMALPEIKDFNGVNLMTIHKSKGLEYPVVLYINKELNGKSINDEFPIDEEQIDASLNIALAETQKNILKKINYDYQTTIDKYYLEEANVVYVAFTRAKIALDILIYNVISSSFVNSYVVPNLQEMITEINPNSKVLEIGVLPEMKHEAQHVNANKIHLPNKFYNRIQSLVGRTQDQTEEQMYGIAFHEAIAKFKSPEDFQQKGEGLLQYAPEIYANVQAFFQHPEVALLFENAIETMEEESFYDGSDQLRQPDKVIIKANETIIIDFKTGQENEAYAEQLAIYEGIFKQLGYPNVKKYVYYTQGNELTEI